MAGDGKHLQPNKTFQYIEIIVLFSRIFIIEGVVSAA